MDNGKDWIRVAIRVWHVARVLWIQMLPRQQVLPPPPQSMPPRFHACSEDDVRKADSLCEVQPLFIVEWDQQSLTVIDYISAELMNANDGQKMPMTRRSCQRGLLTTPMGYIHAIHSAYISSVGNPNLIPWVELYEVIEEILWSRLLHIEEKLVDKLLGPHAHN